MRQTSRAFAARREVAADGEEAGVLALRAGIGLQRHRGEAGDLGQHALQLGQHVGVAAYLLARRERCIAEKRGQDTGASSAAALSFIVHEPSGIIEWTSERSRFSIRFRYRIISVSVW